MTNTPDGIGCDGTCASAAHGFAAGLRVTLAATADPGWVFVGWSGDVDCADGLVTLTDPKTCVATFALTAPLFAKQAPLNGGTTGTRTVTLQWAAAPNASYMVCWDTTNNGVCDTTWQWNATATSRVVELPTTGTYYWQVKTVAAPPTEADEGAWWSVTVTSPPLFTKIAPATGRAAGPRADAAVDAGSERGLLGVLGHDEQQRLRHDVVAQSDPHAGREQPIGGDILLAGEDGGRRDPGGQRNVAPLHGGGAGAVCEAVAGERRDRAGTDGDAAVVGGARRGVLRLLGHDEQQRVRHDVVADRRGDGPRARRPHDGHDTGR